MWDSSNGDYFVNHRRPHVLRFSRLCSHCYSAASTEERWGDDRDIEGDLQAAKSVDSVSLVD